MSSLHSSSRPVGIGVVGTGFGRTTQIPGFLATKNCEIVAVVSHSLRKAHDTASEFGIRRAFGATDYDKFLALDDLDLVCVTSPTDTHREYSVRALEAGKHVLCEKPTAMNAEEAALMLEAARGSGNLALIDHELRFAPARRLFRNLVNEGYLGGLLHVNLRVESPFRLDPTRPWSWWSDAAQGGGMLGALGSHVVDAVRFTFGEVMSARGQLRTMFEERPVGDGERSRRVTSDDYAALWLELEDGATVAGVLSAVSRSRDPGWEMAAHGSDGTLVLSTDEKLWGRRREEDGFVDLTPATAPFDADKLGMKDNMWSRAFVIFAAEIAAHLALGKTTVPLAADFADGLRVQQVLDALRRSSQEESRVACGPDQSSG
jgi:predicted dehydrogenase